MGTPDFFRRIWLFLANKLKSSESVSKQPTQFIFEPNSSLVQKLGTLILVDIFNLNHHPALIHLITFNWAKILNFEITILMMKNGLDYFLI